jgi:hypothetical protein
LKPPSDEDGDHTAEGHHFTVRKIGKAQNPENQRDPNCPERQL